MCGIKISFIALLLAVSFAQTIPQPAPSQAMPVGVIKAFDLVSYFLAHPIAPGAITVMGQSGTVAKVIDGKGQGPDHFDVLIAGERFRVVIGRGTAEASGLHFDEFSVRRYYSGADFQNKGVAK